MFELNLKLTKTEVDTILFGLYTYKENIEVLRTKILNSANEQIMEQMSQVAEEENNQVEIEENTKENN